MLFKTNRGDENIKLALDFHDDAADARFCIRQNASVANPDTITEVFTVDNGNISLTGNVFINNTVNPYLQLGTVNGHNLGVATQAGALSSSAAIGDMVLRSINRLLLLSGQSGYGVMIDSNNYVYFNKLLILNPDNVERPVVENRIITNGGILTGVIGGDIIISGYWGVAINLNSGGTANGGYSGSAGRAYVAGYSAFTINMRSSNIQTTFDRGLFTVMPNGNVTTLGDIDCGGGLAITGANAFAWESDIVDVGNRTNTYINFRNAGATSDWCYLRQIGGDNAYKLSLDFHDDGNDARFCIRKIQSTANPDIISEVFTVDNGNVSCTGKINLNGDNLQFPTSLNQYKINLYGTNSYGFGISGGTLMYSSQSFHRFYNSGNNANTFTIDSAGNVSCTGSITAHGPIVATGSGISKFRDLEIYNTAANNITHFGYNNGNNYIRGYTTYVDTVLWCSTYIYVTGYYYENSGNTRVYMTPTGYLSVNDVGSIPVSIKTSYAIWSGTYLHYSSDIRIKTEINDIIDDMALRKILAIEPKTYKYIDTINRSNNVVYGFIAQQIKEVIPEAVSLHKEVIPNIFKICKCENDEITLDNNIISNNLNINDKIDIYDINNNKKQYTIKNILDNKIKINESINSSNCFVYGKEVNDFHTINKDYIFTLNVCATQELYKLIQGLQAIIQDQQNQINLIKSHLNL